MVSMIWMFIDDNDDDFKTYQRAFRKMEIKKSEEKLLKELENVKSERVGYEENLAFAQKSFDGKQEELINALERITSSDKKKSLKE